LKAEFSKKLPKAFKGPGTQKGGHNSLIMLFAWHFFSEYTVEPSSTSFLENDEKRPCREINTVERFKTGVEGRDVIKIFTARHLKSHWQGGKLTSLRKLVWFLSIKGVF